MLRESLTRERFWPVQDDDFALLNDRRLGRLESDLKSALQENNKKAVSVAIATCRQDFYPLLTPVGRRKLSQRLTKLLRKYLDPVAVRRSLSVEEVHTKSRLVWGLINHECAVCKTISKSNFPALYPCRHREMCNECAKKNYNCVMCKIPIDHASILKVRREPSASVRRKVLEKDANKEREHANRIIRLNALREIHKEAVSFKKERQDYALAKAEQKRLNEELEKKAFEAKAAALKAGKALKRVKDYGRASLKTFTTKQLPPIYSNWKKQKSVTGRDGTGLDDVGTAELERMQRSGFRETDWLYDETFSGIPFRLNYENTKAASRLARDIARDLPALEHYESAFEEEENKIREKENMKVHDLEIFLMEHSLMIEEDYVCGMWRLIDSTKTGDKYDSEKRRLEEFMMVEKNRIQTWKGTLLQDVFDIIADDRLERKKAFVSTIISLQYNSSALRIYYDYCHTHGLTPISAIVTRLTRKQSGTIDLFGSDKELLILGGDLSHGQSLALVAILPKWLNLETISIQDDINIDNGAASLLSAMAELPYLQTLRINGTSLNTRMHGGGRRKRRIRKSKKILEIFCRFQSLTYLDLSRNNIGDQGIVSLASTPWCIINLRTLKLSEVDCTGMVAKYIPMLLQNFKRPLQHFDFSWNDLRAPGLIDLFHALARKSEDVCPNELNLTYCGLSDSVLKHCAAFLKSPGAVSMLDSLLLYVPSENVYSMNSICSGSNLSLEGKETLDQLLMNHREAREAEINRIEELEKQHLKLKD